MSRQLVLCLDGTGNRFSSSSTNVVRIFRCLERDPSRVLSFYDQGVGTFGLKETLFEWQKLPARVLGLAFGWGLRRSAENAYRFICENYRPDDEIFIFGFSRGAYAARAVAAMIEGIGLLPPHQLHLFEYGWSMLLARTNVKRKTRAAAGRTQPDFALQKRFKHVFSSPAKIRFVGLFDTVKSVGWIYDPVVIPYTANNRSVQVVRHAVAIDERRCFFRQHLWDTKQADTTDLAEVWFSGVHSDIGGGYPDDKSQLSRVALRWMLSEACKHGLRLDPRTCAKQLTPSGKIGPDPLAEINVSLKGAWWAAEWVPRLVSRGGRDPTRTLEIGAMPPLRRVRPRPMASKTAIHSSVLQRISGRSDYSPVNMPTEFVQIDDAPCLDELLERAAAEPG